MGKDFQSSDDRPAETQYESAAAGESQRAAETPKAQDSLLDEVLQHTIPTDSEPLSSDELAALQEVARRHGGTEFTVEPAGVALVQCLLELRLPAGVREITPEMSYDIATALFDAPDVRQRLSKLWGQLCESAP